MLWVNVWTMVASRAGRFVQVDIRLQMLRILNVSASLSVFAYMQVISSVGHGFCFIMNTLSSGTIDWVSTQPFRQILLDKPEFVIQLRVRVVRVVAADPGR